MLNPCGHKCENDCPYIETVGCTGCVTLQGKVFWAASTETKTCPIYACAVGRGYDDCGACPELPCKIWMETRDPSFSDEFFAADIKQRISNLKRK
jgi:hypothetical protein